MRSVILLLALATGTANANNSLLVGDGQIDGSKLQAYVATVQPAG